MLFYGAGKQTTIANATAWLAAARMKKLRPD
jgi:hypothetical protein